jgi:hypothetical protein
MFCAAGGHKRPQGRRTGPRLRTKPFVRCQANTVQKVARSKALSSFELQFQHFELGPAATNNQEFLIFNTQLARDAAYDSLGDR